MRFVLQYPIAHARYDPAYLDPSVVRQVAATAEEAGFWAIAFTDHPAPSAKWRAAGGHDAFDPFAALSFCAAVTDRLRLLTYMLVLPYRNPLLAATGAATVDVLSGGRLVLGVASGYLRSEFAALGVDFEERGALFDEALEVLRLVWTSDEFHYLGRHFHALGTAAGPVAVQRPHPPFWFGGNSLAARRRVVALGEGWAPLLTDEIPSSTLRTTAFDTPASLGRGIAELRDMLRDAGRDPSSVEVQTRSVESHAWTEAPDLAKHRGHLEELAAVGVTGFVVDAPASSAAAGIEQLRRYGADVIERDRSDASVA